MECVLRPWRAEDAADLAEVINNKRILDNLRDGLPYPYSKADAERFLAATLAADPSTTYAFAITVDDRAVGSIGAFRQGNVHFRTAELGYYLAQPLWGRGLVTSAVKQLCAYLFQNTDILRVFAQPFAENAASCRVLEKAGFQLEGVLRSNAVKNGVVRDMKLYARIRGPEAAQPQNADPERSEETRRESKIHRWFSMWLDRRDTGIEDLFSPDAVYIESWGPEYHGRGKIKLWFDEWNTRGTVERWDIRQYFHKGDQTVVEWTFQCAMTDGTVQSFDGLSLIRWDDAGQICFLQEFGCNENRYDPYAQGDTPVFREEPALWF